MSIDKVISELGGTSATARIFGVLPSAVSNWKAAGRFPQRLHYRLSREAEARGMKLDESVFEELPLAKAG